MTREEAAEARAESYRQERDELKAIVERQRRAIDALHAELAAARAAIAKLSK